MDFWDLTKLLFRRWYFALPGLVLTLLGVVSAFVVVSPNYIATAYVQLVPPISHPTPLGEQTLDQRNPWIVLGLDNLANAAILTVQQNAVVEAMENSGYSGSFTATLTSNKPLVTFEVTGTSEEQANATTDQLVQRFGQSIQDLQVSTYSVAKVDQVTTRRLDLGSNVKESNARVKRAAVAVGGAGLLCTIALTIGADSLLRRRRAAVADASIAPADADLAPPVATARVSRSAPQRLGYPATPSVGRPGRSDFGSAMRASAGVTWETAQASPSSPAPYGAATAYPTTTQAAMTSEAMTSEAMTSEAMTSEAMTSAVGKHGAASAEQALDGVVDAVETTEPEAVASPASAVMSPDSTLVLPLTHKPWRRRDARGDEESQRR